MLKLLQRLITPVSFVSILMTLVLFIPASTVQANAAPPPPVIWFTFQNEQKEPVTPQGVQLLGCDTMACEQPALLQQFGQCQGTGCLIAEPALTQPLDEFGCAGQRCRSMAYRYGHPYFKLVAQISSQGYVSNIIDGLPAEGVWASEEAWRVTIAGTNLSLAPDAVPPKPFGRYGLFFYGLLLTLVTELAIAALCFRLWLKLDLPQLTRGLAMILLINLVTFPVVWFFFPSLGQFQPDSFRKTGLITLGVAIFYVVMLALIWRANQQRRQRVFIILTLLSIPVVFVLTIFLMLIFGYANYRVPAAGLPAGLILPASELFAVVGEAALLAFFSQGSFSLRQAAELSLLMNLASILVGYLALGQV
jgi:hypothetical protein